MKTRLFKALFFAITLILFAVLCAVLSGCDNVKTYDYVKDDEGITYHIVKIGNHQYIRSFGICHYEDCEYCMKNKGK